MSKEQIVDAVMEDVVMGAVATGDYTVVWELLTFVPTPYLIGAMPEERWAELNELADRWKDTHVQACRLVAEIMATQDNLMLSDLCESMDLEMEDLVALLERISDEWELLKDYTR